MSEALSWTDWVPISLHAGDSGPLVEWCDFTGIRLVDPFFYETATRALWDPVRRSSRRLTSFDFLAEHAAGSPGLGPTGFIFHLSRCGSTLVSRVLAADPANRVISEAPVVDQLLQGPSLSQLPALISALSQRSGDQRRVFFKFDCWHICQLAQIRAAFPRVPWIFVYRDPVEILVSHERMPGIQVVPGMIAPERLGLDPATIDPAALGDYAARVIGRFCQAALAQLDLGGGRLVNYSELPEAIWSSIASHFQLDLTPAEIAQLAAAAEIDAKNPYQRFAADGQDKQAAASPELRARSERWIAPFYRQLEARRLHPPSIG